MVTSPAPQQQAIHPLVGQVFLSGVIHGTYPHPQAVHHVAINLTALLYGGSTELTLYATCCLKAKFLADGFLDGYRQAVVLKRLPVEPDGHGGLLYPA